MRHSSSVWLLVTQDFTPSQLYSFQRLHTPIFRPMFLFAHPELPYSSLPQLSSISHSMDLFLFFYCMTINHPKAISQDSFGLPLRSVVSVDTGPAPSLSYSPIFSPISVAIHISFWCPIFTILRTRG